MQILHRWATVLGLACLIQPPALAQSFPALAQPFVATTPSGGNLIMNKKVQEELGLGSEQIDGVSAAARKVREKYKDEYAKLKSLEPGERAELLAKVDKEVLKAIGDILKPEQAKRLKQIEFQQRVQQRGPGVFLEADVAKELQLTDKQKKRVAVVFNQCNMDSVAALQNRNTEQIPALRKEAMDQIRKSLNDEQKKKLEALTGKPFELKAVGTPAPFLVGSTEHILKKRVQDELKLTDDQVKSIEVGLQKVQEKYKEQIGKVWIAGRPAVPGVPPPSPPDPKTIGDVVKKVDGENKKVLAGVLKPEQANRLKQIELQLQGIHALENKEVVEALKLTEDQKRQVKKLNEDIANGSREIFDTGRGRDRAALMKSFEAQKKLFREAADRIPSLLTPDQQKRWEKLTGKAFQLEP
jgi:hypothetical protein